jgi:hypothetical protein
LHWLLLLGRFEKSISRAGETVWRRKEAEAPLGLVGEAGEAD